MRTACALESFPTATERAVKDCDDWAKEKASGEATKLALASVARGLAKSPVYE